MTVRETPYNGFLVTEEIPEINSIGMGLNVGDLVTEHNGRFTRQAPGICLTGFELTEEQQKMLEPVKYGSEFLDFWLDEDGRARWEELMEATDGGD